MTEVCIMIDKKTLMERLEEVANEHPYKIPGNPDSYSDYSQGWSDCADWMLSVAENMPQIDTFGQWIPCSERLPETDKNRKYLVCGKKGGIYIAEFVCRTVSGELINGSWWQAPGRYCPVPIAWMPLPEAYEEE